MPRPWSIVVSLAALVGALGRGVLVADALADSKVLARGRVETPGYTVVGQGAGFELRLDNVARIQAENMLRLVGGDEAVSSAVSLAYRPPAWRRFEVRGFRWCRSRVWLHIARRGR